MDDSSFQLEVSGNPQEIIRVFRQVYTIESAQLTTSKRYLLRVNSSFVLKHKLQNYLLRKIKLGFGYWCPHSSLGESTKFYLILPLILPITLGKKMDVEHL